MSSKNYRDLIAWQKAIQYVADIYRLTRNFPKDEMYGLTSQLRRASVSIASNIAEGQGRKSPAEFRHFLHNAAGSLTEAETQVTISAMLGYMKEPDADQLLSKSTELGKILNGLINYLDTPADNDREGQRRITAVAVRHK